MNLQTLQFGLIATAAVVCQGTLALGQTACDDVQIQRGYELRRAGHDDEALVEFQHAWEACHTPRALGQMALAEAALGRWVDADRHLAGVLASENDPWVVRSRAQLEDAQSQVAAHVGRLEVLGGAAGAEVLLDARPVGTLPLRQPLRAVAGSAALTVRAPGYAPISRMVIVTPGQLVRETVEMAPLPASVPVQEPAAGPSPVRAPASSVAPRPPLSLREPGASGSTQRMLAWVAVVGAGAALAGGVVSQVVRENNQADFNERCPSTTTSPRLAAACAAESPGQGVSTAQTLAISGYVTAGLLGVVASVLFVTAPRAHGDPRGGDVSWRCGAGPGTWGASCGISF